MRFVHGLANFIRGSVRCMFPLATLAVWTLVLLVPQGTDVIRAALERLSTLSSVGDLIYLWVASGLLGLSLWYSTRWLITAEMPALHFTPPVSPFWRTWVPRVAGAFAPLLVAIILAGSASFSMVTAPALYGTAGAFAVLAFGLTAFFWKRRIIVPSLSGAAGRNADGSPGVLLLGERLPPGTVGVIAWSLVLSAMLGLLCVQFAVTVPRVVGAAAIAALSLASINLFGSFVLTWLPMRHALPPLGPWLVLWAILVSPLTDNHGGRMRPAPIEESKIRPTVGEAYDQWSATLADGDTAPVYVVAAEGGGMRAAYWAAAVLQAFDSTPGFRDHVFALSGVSGGGVGISMWAASVRGAMCGGGGAGPRATDMLAGDFVAPALAGLFFYDFAQRFVPIPFDRLDRSRGLEESMERAGYRLEGRPFEKPLGEFYRGCPHLPELFLNSTVVETGQRAVLSRLDTSRFVDAFVWRSTGETLSWSRQTLAQLTHHSARFPVISPVGSIRALSAGEQGIGDRLREIWWPPIRLRLADGGYFDNSGVQTALDVLKEIRGSATDGLKKRPVTLILITSDSEVALRCGNRAGDDACPLPDGDPPWRRPSVLRWLHETVPIVEALYRVRDSRLHITAAQAIEGFGRHVVMLPLPPSAKNDVKPPLGWALSEQVRHDMLCRAPDVVGAHFPSAGPIAKPRECTP